MNPTRRGLARAGFSAVELMIGVSMIAGACLLVISYIKNRAAIQSLTALADLEKEAASTLDLIENDLHEAAPASFDWATIPQAPPAAFGTAIASLRFNTIHYDAAAPTTPISTTVKLAFQANPGHSTGSLVKSVTDATGTHDKILLTDIEPPTADFPLVYADTSTYHLLNVTLLHHPANRPLFRAVRRVALKG